MKLNTKFLVTVFVVGGIGVLFGRLSRLDLNLLPVSLPPYLESAIRVHVEGEMRVSITFKDSRPVRTSILSSNLRATAANPQLPAGEWIKGGVEDSVIKTLKQWRSLFSKDLETVVSVEFRQDDSLGANDRQYFVHYGPRGVIERIVVTGPPSLERK